MGKTSSSCSSRIILPSESLSISFTWRQYKDFPQLPERGREVVWFLLEFPGIVNGLSSSLPSLLPSLPCTCTMTMMMGIMNRRHNSNPRYLHGKGPTLFCLPVSYVSLPEWMILPQNALARRELIKRPYYTFENFSSDAFGPSLGGVIDKEPNKDDAKKDRHPLL